MEIVFKKVSEAHCYLFSVGDVKLFFKKIKWEVLNLKVSLSMGLKTCYSPKVTSTVYKGLYNSLFGGNL